MSWRTNYTRTEQSKASIKPHDPNWL